VSKSLTRSVQNARTGCRFVGALENLRVAKA